MLVILIWDIVSLIVGDKSFPVPAIILLSIRSVLEIDEDKETILLDLDFIIQWLDGQLFKPENFHLVHNPELQMSMPPVFLEKVWKPDIYLDNLEKLEKLRFMSPPVAVSFNQYVGSLTYKER